MTGSLKLIKRVFYNKCASDYHQYDEFDSRNRNDKTKDFNSRTVLLNNEPVIFLLECLKIELNGTYFEEVCLSMDYICVYFAIYHEPPKCNNKQELRCSRNLTRILTNIAGVR